MWRLRKKEIQECNRMWRLRKKEIQECEDWEKKRNSKTQPGNIIW